MDTLLLLQAWYSRQCNGRWEHEWGIEIGTLDNPGWRVKIDLADTSLEELEINQLVIDNGKDDWMHCRKEGRQFYGHGDPSKLERILLFFLKEIENGNS